MKKIDWAMRIGQQQTACGEESPRLYVTPGKLTHLKKMQELGLAEKEPIHRRGCKCDPKVNPKNAYALTQKAWNWYILCHSLSCIKDLG